WIYTKDPSVQAFTDLMNRCIDKPSEHIQIAGADGGAIQIQWMSRDEKESVIDTDNEYHKVLELSSNVDDKITRARKVLFGATAGPLMADLQRIATTGQGQSAETARETLRQLQRR